jgi:hypothetical protein
MEAICSSEMSGSLQITRYFNSEDFTRTTLRNWNQTPLKVYEGLISLWLYKENNKLRDWKNVFTLHIPPWDPHTYDFVVLTSLTHPRKIVLVLLQIAKAKDLSTPLRSSFCGLKNLIFIIKSVIKCNEFRRDENVISIQIIEAVRIFKCLGITASNMDNEIDTFNEMPLSLGTHIITSDNGKCIEGRFRKVLLNMHFS